MKSNLNGKLRPRATSIGGKMEFPKRFQAMTCQGLQRHAIMAFFSLDSVPARRNPIVSIFQFPSILGVSSSEFRLRATIENLLGAGGSRQDPKVLPHTLHDLGKCFAAKAKLRLELRSENHNLSEASFTAAVRDTG